MVGGRDKAVAGVKQTAAVSASISDSLPPNDSAKVLEKGAARKGKGSERTPTEVIKLLEYTSMPQNFKAIIKKTGFFLLQVDSPWTDWKELCRDESEFTQVFKGLPMHTGDLNEDTFITARRIKWRDAQAMRKLGNMVGNLWYKDLLGYSKKNETLVGSPWIIKLSSRLGLGGHFVDTIQNLEREIPGVRLVWFDRDVHVHLSIFQTEIGSDDFYANRSRYFGAVGALKTGTAFGPDVYRKVSGKTITMPVKAKEVLVVPSPCSFSPVTGGHEINMGTVLFVGKAGKSLLDDLKSLNMNLGFAASVLNFWDKRQAMDEEALEEMVKESFRMQPDELQVREWHEKRDVAHVIWPPSAVATAMTRMEIPGSEVGQKRKSADGKGVKEPATKKAKKASSTVASTSEEESDPDEDMADSEEDSVEEGKEKTGKEGFLDVFGSDFDSV